MIVKETKLPGLLLIEPEKFQDNRGFFMETYQHSRYVEAGIDVNFIQDDHSHSLKDVLKGIHFTITIPQAKLVSISSGSIFDVVVDLRKDSPTFGEWLGINLNMDTPRQLFIPGGFGHGYCVTSEYADIHYKVSQTYNPSDEGGLNWQDPDMAIKWPIKNPVMKERDTAFPFLSEVPNEKLPSVYFKA